MTDEIFWPDSNIEFCKVNFTYKHQNLDDQIFVTYFMPSPDAFQISGDLEGETGEICAWPSRPYWTDKATMVCQDNETSIDALLYTLDAFKVPIY